MISSIASCAYSPERWAVLWSSFVSFSTVLTDPSSLVCCSISLVCGFPIHIALLPQSKKYRLANLFLPSNIFPSAPRRITSTRWLVFRALRHSSMHSCKVSFFRANDSVLACSFLIPYTRLCCNFWSGNIDPFPVLYCHGNKARTFATGRQFFSRTRREAKFSRSSHLQKVLVRCLAFLPCFLSVSTQACKAFCMDYCARRRTRMRRILRYNSGYIHLLLRR